MYHLLMVVLAVGLTSVMMAAGMSYLHADHSLSVDTSLKAVTQYRAIELAFGAYRVANSGASPDVPDTDSTNAAANAQSAQAVSAVWRGQVSPYGASDLLIPRNSTPTSEHGDSSAPHNMVWSYGSSVSGSYLCLSNARDAQGNIVLASAGVYDGILRTATLAGPAAIVSKVCPYETPPPPKVCPNSSNTGLSGNSGPQSQGAQEACDPNAFDGYVAVTFKLAVGG